MTYMLSYFCSSHYNKSEEEGEMIEGADDVRVDTIENESYFPILNDHSRVHLQPHVCGALRELYASPS